MVHSPSRSAALAAVLLLAACGPPARSDDTDAGAEVIDAGPTIDGAVLALGGFVYAHDPGTLYRMNPDDFELERVGDFIYPDGYDQMTDMAADAQGHLFGVSFYSLYAVNPETAACTRLSYLPAERTFNGLSFLPAGTFDPQHEVLVGTTTDGDLFRIDTASGVGTLIGSFGEGLGSSGDVVSVTGFGTMAAVKNADDGMVWLATIDPTTAAATLVYSTGLSEIWGLGFWEGKLYGFAPSGQVHQLDPAAHTTTLLETVTISWWGAAVTTAAPVD